MSVQVTQTRLKLLFTYAKENEDDELYDVTESLLPDLLSFSYSDKESGEADEISIRLKDETGKWAGMWKPNSGEQIQAFILQGNVEKVEKTLPCGKFYVDELSTSGGASGREFEIKAISIPFDKPIRRKVKSRAWEKKKLKEIAEEIAAESEMTLMWDCNTYKNKQYDRIDQKRESDLMFLSRLCEENGLSIKITDAKIVIFEQALYESKSPIMTLTLGKSNILSWDFASTQSETYKSCTVTYYDPREDELNRYTYVDPDADDNGQEYVEKSSVNSLDGAKTLARMRLRNLNARKITGSITLIGNILLVAGSVIECKGFGSFDGKFIIEKAIHDVEKGYTTAINLRRVNSNY